MKFTKVTYRLLISTLSLALLLAFTTFFCSGSQLAQAALPPANFLPKVELPTGGSNSEYISSFDMNKDGKLDLIVVNSGSNNISIFYGNGDGTFQAPVLINTPSQPFAATPADIDNDGDIDLVVSRFFLSFPIDTDGIFVLLNNGNGTFQTLLDGASSGNPARLVVTDLNGDGKLDIVAPLNSKGSLQIRLGNGNGTFGSITNYTVGSSNPTAVAVNDFNNDGKPDVAVASTNSNRLVIFLGNGNGTFQPYTTSYSFTLPPDILISSDVDSDGKIDLVATDGSTYKYTFFKGKGDGTFIQSATSPTSAAAVIMIPGDFNGDGKMDVARAEYPNSNLISIYYGNGDGTFTFGFSCLLDYSPTRLGAGDFNGDGKSDLVLGWWGNSVGLLLSTSVPTLSVADTSVVEGNSGIVQAVFTVTLTGSCCNVVTATYSTADTTATLADSDYIAASGVITFAPGETSKTILVPVNGDTKYEPDETFTLTLGNPQNATLSRATATGTIINDDTPLEISLANSSVVEGTGGSNSMVFTATLSRTSSQIVTATYATTDFTANAPADYTASSGTLTFNVGEVSKTITVPIVTDNILEQDEQFYLNLQDGTPGVLLFGKATGTIIDDDSGPLISIAPVSQKEGNTGTTPVTFTVTLSYAPAAQVTVDYTSQDGTATAGVDYQAGTGKLTFAPGITSQVIIVNLIGDVAIEGDETFTVTLSNAVNAKLLNTQAVGTILDDDIPPKISIAPVSQKEGNVGTSPMTFTVTLSFAPVTTATVDYTTQDGSALVGSDYQAAIGKLTFAPGVTSQLIVVNINGDNTVEADETFTIKLSNPINAGLNNSSAVGTILNDDVLVNLPPALTARDTTVREGKPGDNNSLLFTVTLSSPATATVSVIYATSDGTATKGLDYVATNGTLTFAPGETTKVIKVPVIGDLLPEADETVLLNFIDPLGLTLTRPQAIGTIVDDDAKEQPQAKLYAQLRVTPDRVVNLDPTTLITFTFRVKNDGESRAWQNQLEFPLDPNLELAYADFADKRIWVRLIFPDVVWIPLPDMVKGEDWLEGRLVFRPKAGVTPGTSVNLLRYKVRYEDLSAPLNFKGSNAQSFVFGTESLNVANGEQQQLTPDSLTVPVGQSGKSVITGKPFMPNEEVLMWLTRPDGTSVQISKNDSNYQGITFFELETKNLAPGKYLFTMQGKQSGISASATLLITD